AKWSLPNAFHHPGNPMPLPARNTLAIIGAGPVGLETALAAMDAGLDVHVFERGEVASHPIAWGHVRMFTPWRMNLGPATRAHLERTDWAAPPAEDCPTGLELSELALQPAARLPELANRVHAHSKVIHVSRRGALKGDWVGKPERREYPFRLLVRNAGGRESFLHAFSVVDASGTYGQPNWAGAGGIPARQELYVAPQLSYHLDDVRGLRRERYAGKRTMVIGSGLSAATVVSDLVKLAADAPATCVVWVTRHSTGPLYAPLPADPLEGRRALMEEARTLIGGAHAAVAHIGGAAVEGFEFNSATHRYRVALALGGEEARLEEVDHVIVNAGYRPDDSVYRELQIHECYATSGPMKLAASLLGAGADCLQAPAVGIEALGNPEPDFYIAGAKSYGRNGDFLLETGFRQVAEIVARLTADCAKPVVA
ncbi:MAG: hypothetical protein ABIS67_10455, partial [Candidatus Eisenbacteria bacterium]